MNPQFPTVPRLLYPSERDAWIRSDHFVDEHHARLEFVDESFALAFILSPRARAQTESAVVGNADGIVEVLHAKN